MARLPVVTREMVPPEHLAAFDEVTKGRDSMAPSSPTGKMLNSPQAARLFDQMKNYLRDDSTALPSKTRELAMIVTAREWDSPDVWNLHAALARKSGLSDGLVDAIRDRKELPAITPDEAVVVKFARELHRDHRVGSQTYQEALDQFGVKGLTELTMLMALYAMPSFIAHAFDLDPPADTPEPLLPV